MKYLMIFIAALCFLIVGFALGWVVRPNFDIGQTLIPGPSDSEIVDQDQDLVNQPIFCTQDAKQCPDGSFVSRSGPVCAFAPCPLQPIDTSTWTSPVKNAPYAIQIPKSWQLETETDSLKTTNILTGPEGLIQLSVGTGFGGACPSQNYLYIQLKDEQLTACSESSDEKETISLISRTIYLPDGKTTDFVADAIIKNPIEKNREVILNILKTLEF